MAASGEALIDFGSSPTQAASLAITGQNIAADSRVDCWIAPKATSNNTEDGHAVLKSEGALTVWVPRSSVIANNGFTIQAISTIPLTGVWNVAWAWA